MDNSEFKKIFDVIAKANDFEKAFGGWFKESSECIIVLDLQKSNFGHYYDLNIKIFVHGMFGNHYSKSKDLVKKHVGNAFARQPSRFAIVLDLETSISDNKRREMLEQLFAEFIVPFANKALSKRGLKDLADSAEIVLLPAVNEQLLALIDI